MTTEKELSDAMAFDHPIRVHEDGSISDVEGYYAPEFYSGEIESNTGWTVVTGWSGQYNYSGPVMHDSEYIGGALAKHILETPGIWVCAVCHWDHDYIEGWGLFFREINE